jgi:hypothetical protein
MSNHKRRKGIVWLASYPRSGNTWTRNFLYNLLNLVGGGDGTTSQINRLSEFSLWDIGVPRFEKVLRKTVAQASLEEIAAARPIVQKKIAGEAPGPVLVKTHNALVLDRGVSTINMSVTAGAVYIVRNPLDVAISYAHHFGIDIDTAIQQMNTKGLETGTDGQSVYEVYGSWSQNVMSWTQKPHPAIYVMRYEDMLARSREIFSGLARHLLIAADDKQIERTLELASFERARAQEKAAGYRERPLPSGAFFREGRAEQWRQTLSKEQISCIVEQHREQMTRFGYVPEDY